MNTEEQLKDAQSIEEQVYSHIHLPIADSDYITHSFHVKERTFVVTFQKRTFEIDWAEGGTLAFNEVAYTEGKPKPTQHTTDLTPAQQGVLLYAAARVTLIETCATFFYDLYNDYYNWAETRNLPIVRRNALGRYLRKHLPDMKTARSVDGQMVNVSFLKGE